MFNFIIVLNSAPHFFLAQNEEEVLEVTAYYKDKVVRIISGTDLKVQDLMTKTFFSNHRTVLIPQVVDEKQLELVSEEEKELTLDQISTDLDN